MPIGFLCRYEQLMAEILVLKSQPVTQEMANNIRILFPHTEDYRCEANYPCNYFQNNPNLTMVPPRF